MYSLTQNVQDNAVSFSTSRTWLDTYFSRKNMYFRLLVHIHVFSSQTPVTALSVVYHRLIGPHSTGQLDEWLWCMVWPSWWYSHFISVWSWSSLKYLLFFFFFPSEQRCFHMFKYSRRLGFNFGKLKLWSATPRVSLLPSYSPFCLPQLGHSSTGKDCTLLTVHCDAIPLRVLHYLSLAVLYTQDYSSWTQRQYKQRASQ